LIDTINQHLFKLLLPVSKWFTETDNKNRLGRPIMRFLGWFTVILKNGKKKQRVEDMVNEWRNMFPDKEKPVILKIEGETAYAEIRTKCPYRATGNVQGCYRMMEYDRKMLEKIGGDFVVLRSQAEANVEHCKIAITNELGKNQSLVQAHLKE